MNANHIEARSAAGRPARRCDCGGARRKLPDHREHCCGHSTESGRGSRERTSPRGERDAEVREKLTADEEIKSADGKYTLRMLQDGNLVLLNDADKVEWHAGTAPNSGAVTTMQRDGNLTIVSAGNKPLWHTGTQGAGANLHVQNDGNLTVRTPDGKVLWASR